MAQNLTTVLLTLLTAFTLLATSRARAAEIANPSFESDVLGANTYCISYASPMCSAVTGWTGNFFLANGAPQALTPPMPLPDGVQFSMVQATNSMAQSVTIDVPGAYELTWSDAGRGAYINAAGNETYDVLLAGNLLGSFSTTTGSAWISHSLIFSADAGEFLLTLAGTKPFSQGDNSVLFDNFALQMSDVPEPSTFVLMGLGVAGLALRRRD